MKKLLILLLVSLVACDPVEVQDLSSERVLTFNVEDPGGKPFSALVSWGEDKIFYNDQVDGALSYNSVVSLYPAETFHIKIISRGPLKLTIRSNATGAEVEQILEPGILYILNPKP